MKEKELKISNTKGITLIALIITIIVMLILVGVTVSITINGGLFSNAKQATSKTQYEVDREILISAVIGTINDNAEVDFEKLDKNLPIGFTGSKGTYTSKAGNNFTVDKNGSITTPKPIEVTVTVAGQTKTITKENVGEFLGRVVTNYKEDYETFPIDEINIGSETYTVSTTYRLYYVDFENKYGDGAGTIYLKADCTGYTEDNNILQTTAPSEGDVVKIKELNPGLYKDKEGNPLTPPSEGNKNMKAVTWLTNTNNWEELKNYLNEGINKDDINYIVGAPSLEMMIDSYNTHYGLTGNTPNTNVLDENSARVKLFYQYTRGRKWICSSTIK